MDAEIVEVAAHCGGPSDVPGLGVLLDGGRPAWLLLSDIVAVQRPPARNGRGLGDGPSLNVRGLGDRQIRRDDFRMT